MFSVHFAASYFLVRMDIDKKSEDVSHATANLKNSSYASSNESIGLSDLEKDLNTDTSDTTVVEFPIQLNKSQRKRLNRKNRRNESSTNGGRIEAGSTFADPVASCSSSSVPLGTDPKRPRSAGGTPSEDKPIGKRVKSYAEVMQREVYFRVGVVDGLAPGLTDENRILLIALIHNAIVNGVEDGDFIPIMRGHNQHGNLVVFLCANEETSTWLKNQIQLINNNWDGNQLFIVDNPEFTKLKVWLFGPIEEPKRVFNLFEKMNAGLNTSFWRLAKQLKYEKKGQLLFIFVDPDSLEFIKKFNMKLQYILNLVTFKVAGDKPAPATLSS